MGLPSEALKEAWQTCDAWEYRPPKEDVGAETSSTSGSGGSFQSIDGELFGFGFLSIGKDEYR